jgi:hypothetical protein
MENNLVRLQDGVFSDGFETVIKIVRCGEFTTALGDAIRTNGPERGVVAMNREYFPPVQVVASDQPLPPDHYIVPCRYAAPPSMKSLKNDFPGGVSGIFDGRVWRRYSLRVRTNETPGNRIMVAKRFNCAMESEDVIAWGLDNDLVPAMGHNEALDFRRAKPELQIEFPIVALGSFTLDGSDGRSVAVLRAIGGGPCLGSNWFGGGWNADCGFLFLRK